MRPGPAAKNLPTPEGVVGSEQIFERISEAARSRTPIIALISGGGSALLPAPVEGVSLADKLETTKLLQDAGATIDEVNSVRKHLSRVKGGGLASWRAGTSTLLSLIISDVSGDPLDVIGSGPSVPDPTTFTDAMRVTERYAVALPRSVTEYLRAGREGERPETLKQPVPGQLTQILANNRTARMAAVSSARALNWTVEHHDQDEGGSNESLAEILAARIRTHLPNADRPTLIVSGGETTVKLCPSPGRGGRNQELGLEIWLRLTPEDRSRVTILTAGTDGEDGPTDAAGCLIEHGTLHRNELFARTALSANDVFPFLEHTGTLLRTGPTGTNVMDLRLILIRSLLQR